MFKTLFYFLLACLFFSCSTKTKECKKNQINPNGDSELALVMRALYNNTLSIKSEYIKNTDSISNIELNLNIIEDFTLNYEALNHAEPTDHDLRNDGIYKGFTDIYINSSTEFLTNKYSKENYNLMVNNCIQCHEQFCLGTIDKIRKLYIR